MAFNGAIHSFQISSPKEKQQHFFTSPENRKELAAEIKRQLKWEKGNIFVGNEKNTSCVSHVQIAKNNFLNDIQEYAASQEGILLDDVYMGQKQSCYNHLIEIRNSIGIYLPVYFFFPMMISIKQHALPIFVGSSIKLYTELKQLNKKLEADKKVDIDITAFLDASDEDVEDYETSYDEVENFWPCFSYLTMMSLVKRGVQSKLPIFVF